MAKFSVSALFFLTTQLVILHSFSNPNPNPLFIFCPTKLRNYTRNSTFENNLINILESLPSNTSISGFYNKSSGVGSDAVYGQALCRGDVNSTVCRTCVENAGREILKQCASQEAIIWYELCQIHYSFQMFFTLMVYTGKYPETNNQEKNISDPVRFSNYLSFLMSNLSNQADNDSSKAVFATGEIQYSKKVLIYGLVQCTGDISQSQCSDCLKSAIGDLEACCSYREGGIILSRNCNMRFEIYKFYNAFSNLLTYPSSKDFNSTKQESIVIDGKWKIWTAAVTTCASTFILAVLVGFCIVHRRQINKSERDEEKSERAILQNLASSPGITVTEEGEFVSAEELPFLDVSIIKEATDNFSDSNKLGQGGFGTVYKGVLADEREVAVKRLSRKSWQGLMEFKSEIILIAKLQHRNLVRLLGCGIDGEEKLLVYEFMPNKSLDRFIFDSERRVELDWNAYFNIITGISRGLLYLHEDSRLKIIHRDLKPSNVLLDNEMVAKISDFGMARIFGEKQDTANTRRVVGSYGYMAPEYAMEGLFSVKSDVFSFGVVLLEIISGKRNNGFYLTERALTLLAYVWQLWNEGKEVEIVDPWLLEYGTTTEILRCIQIGLLCVQEDPADRPNMSSVVVLLGSKSIALPQPKKPAFSVGKIIQFDQFSEQNPSVNRLTVSTVSPR